jgi:imidazoleglycerol-phosphate dehydratase
MRTGEFARKTRETEIATTINLDGTGKYELATGLGFFEHMLSAFAVHGGFDLKLSAKGDIEVDSHHTVEDAGIVLGEAFLKALGDKSGITRFGSCYVPMDEALAFACVDISGRPFVKFDFSPVEGRYMENFDPALLAEFFRPFAFAAKITLHVQILYGDNPHHMVEAVFKAVARALRAAVALSGGGVPSTKGSL